MKILTLTETVTEKITFVRPILKYASHIWNPFTCKSVNDLEHVQRYFTSRIPALKYLSYSERLDF